MPKMKTKSAVKKRFKLTASGKVRSAQSGKRHCMIKRSNSQLRRLRGTKIGSPAETKAVKKWLPYGEA